MRRAQAVAAAVVMGVVGGTEDGCGEWAYAAIRHSQPYCMCPWEHQCEGCGLSCLGSPQRCVLGWFRPCPSGNCSCKPRPELPKVGRMYESLPASSRTRFLLPINTLILTLSMLLAITESTSATQARLHAMIRQAVLQLRCRRRGSQPPKELNLFSQFRMAMLPLHFLDQGMCGIAC